MEFKVGDMAVYPAHGVGEIKRIETRCIGGADADFYVLQILSSGASLMIPARNCERSGMRPILSGDAIERVYAVLRSPAKVLHTTWNRRFREMNDKLRNGDAIETAEVLRDLHSLATDKDLSYGEKKMLDKALSLLASEIGISTNTPADEVEGVLLTTLRGRYT